MKSALTCFFFGLSLLLFASHVSSTESSGGEISLEKISPNVIYVVRGESLMLNVTLDARNHSVFVGWIFQPHLSTTRNKTFYVEFTLGPGTRPVLVDDRLSVFNGISLLLVNTTLNDSGEYICQVTSGTLNRSLSFNVTIIEKPKAETNCSKKVGLTEGDDLFCLCKARGVNLVPSASWMNNGGPQLSLIKVSKEDAGTYVCRVQLRSFADRTSTEVVVYYRPRINYFQCSTSKNNVMTLACVADGLPRPDYTITGLNGTELSGVENGVVTLRNHSSNLKALYRCRAKNTLGDDHHPLDPLSLERCLSHLPVKTPPNRSSWLLQKVDLYTAIICAVLGLVLGLALFGGCQRLCRKKASVNLRSTRREHEMPLYDEPIAMATSPTDSTYQPLSPVRRDEENQYQNLQRS